MPLSVYSRTNILKALFNDVAFPLPATVFAALLTQNPTDDAGTGIAEASYSGYARVGVAANTTNFPAPAGGTVSPQVVNNATTITFATPTVNVTITGIAVYDASTAGNMLFWTPLGIESPINPPTVAGSGTGGSMAAGTHYWAFTQVDSLGNETMQSPTSAPYASAGTASSAVITMPALPTGVASYNVYRNDGAAWGKVGNATTTSFTDTGTALGAVPPYANGTNGSQLIGASTAITIPANYLSVAE